MGFRIITINREFESGGNEIAQAVAARLGLPYYDRFLIIAASGETGIDQGRVASIDEKLESRFEYSQAEAAYYYTNNKNPLPTGARVAEAQFQLIEALAEQEPCLIVGRCANYVLRGRDDVLDIFIRAGMDFRLQRTIERLALPERKAARILKRTDNARRAYYKNYTGCDWNDPNLYHAVLNSDRMGFEGCVDAICDLYCYHKD
jgi:cytidylate kinase